MVSLVITVALYRVAIIAFGFGFAYLGYCLFREGLTKNAGELKATFGEKALTIRQVAPGIWFAFFGTAISCFSVYRGFDVSTENSHIVGVPQVNKNTTEEPEVPDQESQVGMLLKIDPELDLDNMPRRMQEILIKLQTTGTDNLDNQEKRLLEIYMGKLKARVTAAQGGTES